MKATIYMAGKMLELAAMVLLGIALFIGLTQDRGMGRELTLLGIGSVIFYCGLLLERRGAGE